MNIKDENTKAQMRAWPESKKMTLLRQQRMIMENVAKEANRDDSSRLFFDSCPLIIFGMLSVWWLQSIEL